MIDDARRRRTLAELQPYIQRARSFSGWTFDDLRQKRLTPDYPWDYEAIARERAGRARTLLDIGTGGGEVLSRILDGLTVRAVATEEWSVNVRVAQARLAPLGVPVLPARSEERRLPFRDAAFDLVLSRHEGFDPDDLARLVAPGGAIITSRSIRRSGRSSAASSRAAPTGATTSRGTGPRSNKRASP
jgi:SAM-dependent methyltransferase